MISKQPRSIFKKLQTPIVRNFADRRFSVCHKCKRLGFAILITLLSLSLSGCSLLIAAVEKEGPDPGALRNTDERSDVEEIFGKPIEACVAREDFTFCRYEYNYECDIPTHEFIRMALYDLATFGIAEIVFTPLTAYWCAKVDIIEYQYDNSNKVISSYFVYPEEGLDESESNVKPKPGNTVNENLNVSYETKPSIYRPDFKSGDVALITFKNKDMMKITITHIDERFVVGYVYYSLGQSTGVSYDQRDIEHIEHIEHLQ